MCSSDLLGQSSLIVLCAGSTLLLTPVVCPANVSGINLQIDSLSPTGSIKPRFHIEGKLAAVLIIPSSWGSPTRLPSGHIKSFSGAVAGEEEPFCKGSLSLSISLFCFCLALFILFCLFASLYQRHKKISSYFKLLFTTCFIMLAING